jgi:multidrug resistance efflux pump
MQPEVEKIDFTPLEVPRVRRGSWAVAKIGAAVFAIVGAAAAWHAGYRPWFWATESKVALKLIEIDRGDINLVVQETGSIESANNTTLRCEVEAILGTISSTQTGAAGKTGAAGTGSTSAQGGSGQGTSGSGGTGGTDTAASQSTASKSKSKSKTATKKGSSSTSKTGSTSTSSSSATSSTSGTSSTSSTSSSTSTMGSSSGTGSGASSSTATGSSGGSSGTATSSKPVIQSFTYTVERYVPLRPVTAKAADTTAQKKAQQQQKGGFTGGRGGRGGGGRGGRGGGRGGASMFEDEKPASTTIIEIVPQGMKVKTGEIVCKFDSSALSDEEEAQYVRWLQAKSYVEQANAILEVNLITLKEYRDGINPLDLQLIRQYIATCELDFDRLQKTAAWSQDMLKKGFRSQFQVNADLLARDQAEISLKDARGMLERLTKHTGPKIIKSLEANVQAIRADKLMQDAAFSLESQRLERIRRNIRNCIVKAPRDGIVVYVNQTNRWGQITAPIDQGVGVRQGQPIINLPDPLHMRVKARINESKVNLVHTGQIASIVVDAFPQQPLRGHVAEITAINVPLNASDVRVYYANIDIEKGFDELRPGLSAEVNIMIDRQPNVTRVPLEAVRWAGGQSYVALFDRSRQQAGTNPWHWLPVQLGASDTHYAEVMSGLEAEDRIVADPRALPEPAPSPAASSLTSLANLGR